MDKEKVEEESSEELESEELESDESEQAQPEEETESPEPTFKLGDEEVTAEQIKEWKEGSLRQKDYTMKTQELAELRKQYEGRLERDEEFKTPEEKQAKDFIDKIVDRKLGERLRPLQEEQEDIKIKKEIDEVKERFDLSDKKMNELLKIAADMNLPPGSLEFAYKSMAYDKDKAEAERSGEANAAKNLEKRKATITETGGASSEKPKESLYKRGDNYQDVVDKILTKY